MRNPWMSMYLSAANRVAGAARSQFMAEAARQRTAATKTAADQLVSFWFGGMAAPAPKKKQKPRRRRPA